MSTFSSIDCEVCNATIMEGEKKWDCDNCDRTLCDKCTYYCDVGCKYNCGLVFHYYCKSCHNKAKNKNIDHDKCSAGH